MRAVAAFTIAIFASNAAQGQAVSYDTAAASTGDFECTYGLPSFFGETAFFKAHVRGNSFHAVEANRYSKEHGVTASRDSFATLASHASVHWVRLDEYGYFWNGEASIRFDLKQVNKALLATGQHAPYNDVLLHPVPPPNAECRPTKARPILIPKSEKFHDLTHDLISELRENSGSE